MRRCVYRKQLDLHAAPVAYLVGLYKEGVMGPVGLDEADEASDEV